METISHLAASSHTRSLSSSALPSSVSTHSASLHTLHRRCNAKFHLRKPIRLSIKHRFSVKCSTSSEGPHSSSSSAAGGWDDDDCKYLEAHVVEAVSLFPSQGHLFMTLADGGQVEINHVYRPKGSLLYRSRNPTIFLKIVHEKELLLPIVVGDLAVGMLMNALHGEENTVRPNQYRLMMDLVGSLHYEVRMVRITQRVADTYLARIYIGKPGEKEMQSIDARPSDAVNLAVRCKVPIYVNKDIIFTDAVTPVYAISPSADLTGTGNTSVLDMPQNGNDPVSEELVLVWNMLFAAAEERYSDAARWRDELNNFRQEH